MAKKEEGRILRKLATHPLFTLVFGIVSGIVSALLVPFLLDRLSVTEPKLIYIGSIPPQQPTFQVGRENGKDVLHVTSSIRIMNYGFRRGHVDKVEIVRDGLVTYPEKVELLHLDQTDLGWWEERAVGFEFIVMTERHPDNKNDTRRFRLYFYGPTGNEIYAQTMELEGYPCKEPAEECTFGH